MTTLALTIGGGILLIAVVAIAFFGRPKRDPLMGAPRAVRRADVHTPVDRAGDRPALNTERIAELRRMVAEGRKIEAIKQVRDWTKMGLSEAKDLIESL